MANTHKSPLSHPGFSRVEEAAEAALDTHSKITVLMIDDQPMVGEAVKKMLEDQEDIHFEFCGDPTKALQVAANVQPTVILQDLVMPNVDGLTMVKFFRANPSTKEVPMIVLSSREEADIKSQAFSLGANDYMVKLPDKLEVVARIRYHSKAYNDSIEKTKAFNALKASQEALKVELDEAERYVKSLLPDPLDSDVFTTDWEFTTSTDLGGDAFGYHWLDDDHFALYLLDVCGHGVGAALLSVSATNVLRAQSLADVDFKDPAAVLSGLNETFDMDKQNQMYFTFFYGVYNKSTRELIYSCGGHPPSVLIRGKDSKIEMLHTPGMVIGGMPGVPFKADSIKIEPKDKLYFFSDGVFEIEYADREGMMTVEEFADELAKPSRDGLSKVKSMVRFSAEAQQDDAFEDDFSLVEICFK